MTTYPTTITAIKEGLRQGDFTAVELVEAVYQRIEVTDEQINAFISYQAFKDQALEAAAEADARGYGEDAPLLNGVPMGIKDNIVTKDFTTTAASKMLEDFVPTYDATVVQKLKDAGAIIIGKLNLDEFAMGGSTETSYFGPTHNPWNLKCVPGGSSGGSAAAVAARQVPATLGTDTGGSIRQPAAFNGVVGMKPTYGVVSRLGSIAMASSMDQVGPLTLTVEDNALVLEAIAGYDQWDSMSLKDVDTNYSAKIGQSLEGLKIAYVEAKVDEADAKALADAVAFYQAAGAVVEKVEIDYLDQARAIYYVLSTAEASSNMARYDGIRFGYRPADPKALDDIYLQSRKEGLGEEVQRRILMGTYFLSSGQYEEYFERSARIRTLLKQAFEAVFENYDLILLPTTPTPAYELDSNVNDPEAMYEGDKLTTPANLAGLPALSMPAGFDADGLPIGLQLIGNYLDEATIYQAAAAFEKGHDFVDQAPSL